MTTAGPAASISDAFKHLMPNSGVGFAVATQTRLRPARFAS
jgi:hypothetical protein